MKFFTAEEVLAYLIDLLLYYLEDLQNADPQNKDEFLYGEKTAYVECLEIIQKWRKSADFGLDFDIEKKFPL